MAGWVVWLLVAVALAVGEIFTLGFFLGPVALAAALAAVAAGLGLGFEAQLAVFVVASLASLLLVRPVARRHLRTPARLRTGAAALVGEAAVVLERIDRGGGSVRLRGEVGRRVRSTPSGCSSPAPRSRWSRSTAPPRSSPIDTAARTRKIRADRTASGRKP